jgi:hypothetical protein
MTRLFTFGCSFTNYHWPTWADILGQEYDVYENWGRNGAGNHFILYSLIEASRRRSINANDTVAIMFTAVGREDRFLKGQWQTEGSVYNSSLTQDYLDNFTDPTGYFLTNIAVIDSVKKILDGIGCKYHLMSTVPFDVVDDSYLQRIFTLKKDVETQVRELYQDTINQISPSVFEVIFKQDWNSRDTVIIPAAQSHATMIFQDKYKECAGVDWPSFEDFMKNQVDNIEVGIIKEINDQFGFGAWRDRILTQRQDKHLTPAEHQEYLEKIGFVLSDKQKEYAQTWNQKVMSDVDIGFESKKIDRF